MTRKKNDDDCDLQIKLGVLRQVEAKISSLIYNDVTTSPGLNLAVKAIEEFRLELLAKVINEDKKD